MSNPGLVLTDISKAFGDTEANDDVSAMAHGEALRVLVAEDQHINQMLVTTILEKAGHHADVVANGLEALEAIQAAPYDLILMDIQMPEMDGPSATREIRRLPGDMSSVPIIALTANAMAGDRESYISAGMSDYVSKPLDPGALFAAITRVMSPDGSIDQRPGPERVVDPDGWMGAIPLFDEEALGRLREALGQDDLGQMLQAVPGESERLLNAIQNALTAGDLEAARRFAHSLKGMAGNFAASRIEAVARMIEVKTNSIGTAEAETANLERAIRQTEIWLAKAG